MAAAILLGLLLLFVQGFSFAHALTHFAAARTAAGTPAEAAQAGTIPADDEPCELCLATLSASAAAPACTGRTTLPPGVDRPFPFRNHLSPPAADNPGCRARAPPPQT
jgi:hypothetical protein